MCDGFWPCLSGYQTLITGVLAVVAAAWTIIQTRVQYRRERKGRLRAARAALPVTLSAILDHASLVARALADGWPVEAKFYPHMTDVLAERRFDVTVPPFSVELIAALERIVELADRDDVAERIESILREAQVLHARCRGLSSGELVSLHYYAGLIGDAAALYARAESLIEYARRLAPGVSTSNLWDRTFASLPLMRVEIDLVREVLQQERAAGLPPGEADIRLPA